MTIAFVRHDSVIVPRKQKGGDLIPLLNYAGRGKRLDRKLLDLKIGSPIIFYPVALALAICFAWVVMMVDKL